ncbi:AzlC family ABC transporter permease [Natronospirillum operosum]|nr:AzlC family ABC transporter permease [Natronospirillum operosum]
MSSEQPASNTTMNSAQTCLTVAGTWAGFRRMAPLSLFVIVFGMAFSVAAMQAGLTSTQIMLMSGLVFAGASQFGVLEVWASPISLATVVVITFAINSRHLLMSASLYPWLRELPPRQRYSTLFFLSDANWALSLQDYYQGFRDVGGLLGGGLALWSAWMIGTAIGVGLGSGFDDPERWGLDVIMSCFLLAMIFGGSNKKQMILPWSAAVLATMAALQWLPDNTHVIVGALAGGLVGILIPERSEQKEAAS